MRKFIYRLASLTAIVVAIFAVLLLAIPADKNAYVCEYNKKVEIIKTTPGPRLILLGATSSLAFCVDSKQIADSLGIRVVNMGLSAGIGSKFYFDDMLKYIKKGDYVLLCPSYCADYTGDENGFMRIPLDLMIATGWRNFSSLNLKQTSLIVRDIPKQCFQNAVRLLKAPIRRGFDTPTRNEEFKYVASGFNKYGDEASHWTLPYRKGVVVKKPSKPLKVATTSKSIDKDFIHYLKEIQAKYEQKGAIVRLMPEISSESNYIKWDVEHIEKELHKYGLSFFTSSKNLVFSDSFGYGEWGSAHFNREGVTAASARIALLVKKDIHQ